MLQKVRFVILLTFLQKKEKTNSSDELFEEEEFNKFLELIGERADPELSLQYLNEHPKLLARLNPQSGETIAHLVVGFSTKETTEKLCENPQFKALAYWGRNKKDETIIHYYVRRKKEDDKKLLPYLIERFPKLIDVKDQDEKTALDYAKDQGKEWAISLLEESKKSQKKENKKENKKAIISKKFPLLFSKKESLDGWIMQGIKNRKSRIFFVEKLSNETCILSKKIYSHMKIYFSAEEKIIIISPYEEKYNRMSDYLKQKMLNLSSSERISFFEFLIEIAQELCSEKMGPDLMGINNIMGVLQCNPISRLDLLNKIKEEHRQIFDNLKKFSSYKNGKWQRMVFEEYQNAIPSLETLKSDLEHTFSLEIKEKIVSDILFVKRICETLQGVFETDLEEFLENVVPLSEDEMHRMSYLISKPHSHYSPGIEESSESFSPSLFPAPSFLTLAPMKKSEGSNSARVTREEQQKMGARVGATKSWQG